MATPPLPDPLGSPRPHRGDHDALAVVMRDLGLAYGGVGGPREQQHEGEQAGDHRRGKATPGPHGWPPPVRSAGKLTSGSEADLDRSLVDEEDRSGEKQMDVETWKSDLESRLDFHVTCSLREMDVVDLRNRTPPSPRVMSSLTPTRMIHHATAHASASSAHVVGARGSVCWGAQHHVTLPRSRRGGQRCAPSPRAAFGGPGGPGSPFGGEWRCPSVARAAREEASRPGSLPCPAPPSPARSREGHLLIPGGHGPPSVTPSPL